MNKEFLTFKAQKAKLNRAIRGGDIGTVNDILDEGIPVGRNQIELGIRCFVNRESTVSLEDRTGVFNILYNAIRRDKDMLERASRYTECTLITLGHHGNPLRLDLMGMMGIVPGETAGTHYGKYTPRNQHLMFDKPSQ